MNLVAKNKKIIIVVSEFNKNIIERLVKSAIETFVNNGGNKNNIKIFYVPGAFEIPSTIKEVLNSQISDAIIAIGAVIRGETPHFDYIASEAAKGLMSLSIKSKIPIINGILTTDNVYQAIERSGEKNNKGCYAMEAALKMIFTYELIQNEL